MTNTIVTSTYRYKPPRKRKPRATIDNSVDPKKSHRRMASGSGGGKGEDSRWGVGSGNQKRLPANCPAWRERSGWSEAHRTRASVILPSTRRRGWRGACQTMVTIAGPSVRSRDLAEFRQQARHADRRGEPARGRPP
jgi:hypothetical protein